jgi:hypothetical protein
MGIKKSLVGLWIGIAIIFVVVVVLALVSITNCYLDNNKPIILSYCLDEPTVFVSFHYPVDNLWVELINSNNDHSVIWHNPEKTYVLVGSIGDMRDGSRIEIVPGNYILRGWTFPGDDPAHVDTGFPYFDERFVIDPCD